MKQLKISQDTYQSAAGKLTKAFKQPDKLVLFLSEASYLMMRFLFETRNETNISDNDFADRHYSLIQFMDMVAAPWISNPEAPNEEIASGLQLIIEGNGIEDLQNLVSIISYAYDYCHESGDYHAYTEIQAFNELIYTLQDQTCLNQN
jgi:hypothetical protein